MEENKSTEKKTPTVLKPAGTSSGAPAAKPAQPAQPAAPAKEKVKYVVKTEFRDVNDFSQVHHVGKDVAYMGKARLEHLVNTGVVEKK